MDVRLCERNPAARPTTGLIASGADPSPPAKAPVSPASALPARGFLFSRGKDCRPAGGASTPHQPRNPEAGSRQAQAHFKSRLGPNRSESGNNAIVLRHLACILLSIETARPR